MSNLLMHGYQCSTRRAGNVCNSHNSCIRCSMAALLPAHPLGCGQVHVGAGVQQAVQGCGQAAAVRAGRGLHDLRRAYA